MRRTIEHHFIIFCIFLICPANSTGYPAISRCMHATKPLCTSLNKQLARIALPDDDLIEKIDKELSKGKAGVQTATEPKRRDAATVI